MLFRSENSLLLKADTGVNSIEPEVVAKCALLAIESGKFRDMRDGFETPLRTVSEQRRPIHEQGLRFREVRAKAVENGKAVGIDIAPVDEMSSTKPRGDCQPLDRIAATENHHAVVGHREGEARDFVLDYKDAARSEAKFRELGSGHREIGKARERQSGTEKTKANQGGPLGKTVAGLELLSAIYRVLDCICRKHEIEQLSQQHLARLDELGVDARDIDLPRKKS